MANVSADMGELLEEDERDGNVQGSHGAMGNANGGGMCAADTGRMASGHGTMANDAPAIAQHGEQQQDTYSTVPDLLQHTTLQLVLQHEDEEQEQHEQIAGGVEGTPDSAAQQHGGNSSAHEWTAGWRRSRRLICFASKRCFRQTKVRFRRYGDRNIGRIRYYGRGG